MENFIFWEVLALERMLILARAFTMKSAKKISSGACFVNLNLSIAVMKRSWSVIMMGHKTRDTYLSVSKRGTALLDKVVFTMCNSGIRQKTNCHRS